MRRMVVVVSGGMDSVTLAHHVQAHRYEPHLFSVDYGQRHVKELEMARHCAVRLGAQHTVVELPALSRLAAGSALTSDEVDVPLGHYAAPTMKATVVANRNMVFLSLAASLAVTLGAEAVATGVHAGDHAIYPDCRPEFIEAMTRALRLATEGFAVPGFRVHAPFVSMTKADIVATGARLQVPFEQTWSCYKGGELHCGQCGTCVERKEAFALAGVADPTAYAPA